MRQISVVLWDEPLGQINFIKFVMENRGKCCPFFSKMFWGWLSFVVLLADMKQISADSFGWIFGSHELLRICDGKQGEVLSVFVSKRFLGGLIDFCCLTGGNEMYFSRFFWMNLRIKSTSSNLRWKTGGNAVLFSLRNLGDDWLLYSYWWTWRKFQSIILDEPLGQINFFKLAMGNREKCCPFFP